MLWTRCFALRIRLSFWSKKNVLKDPLLVLENISPYVPPLKRTVLYVLVETQKHMETPPFIRSFEDNQSSLMDRFERLSFEAHLNNALLGRSLSESGFSSMYNAVLDHDPSPPTHVEKQDCHKVRRGLRLNKMLKNLMKPIRYCSRRITRGKKQEAYDLDARSFKKWQTFSKSVRLFWVI